MSTVVESILSVYDTSCKVTSLNKKRWHMAFTTIYCSRAFIFPSKNQYSSLVSTNTPINALKISPHSPSRFVIDVIERHRFFPDIDRSILTTVVKEKKIDQLEKLGGVDGISNLLRTDQHSGIKSDENDIVCRSAAFGKNTYPKAPTKSFFHFVWEAFQVRM